MTFIPPGEKISIGSIDEPTEENSVSAQYYPNGLQLEFTGAEGRTMSVELLFDGYEEHESIQGQVAKLEKLATVRQPNSPKDEMRRPHHCVVTWGTVMGGGDNKFRCVIEQISTKYTMFSSGGVPLRASVTLKL